MPTRLETIMESVKKDPSKAVQAGCGLVVALALCIGLASSPADAIEQAPLSSYTRSTTPGATASYDEPAGVEGASHGWTDRSLPRRSGPGARHADDAHLDGEQCQQEGIEPPRDPAALAEAIGRFRRSTDAHELEELAVALGQVDDPRVENLALEVAAADPHPVRRVAAFEVLDAIEPPGAVAIVLEALERERDPQVRRAALFALPPPEKAGTEDAGLVGAALMTVLAGDPDPEARRRAALGLGSWSCAPGAVLALADALRQDPSAIARGGCAFALEVAGCAEPAARGALLESLSDEEEDPVVRDNAWHALATLSPLDERERAAWTAWRQVREQELE